MKEVNCNYCDAYLIVWMLEKRPRQIEVEQGQKWYRNLWNVTYPRWLFHRQVKSDDGLRCGERCTYQDHYRSFLLWTRPKSPMPSTDSLLNWFAIPGNEIGPSLPMKWVLHARRWWNWRFCFRRPRKWRMSPWDQYNYDNYFGMGDDYYAQAEN